MPVATRVEEWDEAWALSRGRPWIGWLRLAMSTLGVFMVFFLVWAELFSIDAICLWCTAVHVILVALFIAVVVGEAMVSQPQPAITTD